MSLAEQRSIKERELSKAIDEYVSDPSVKTKMKRLLGDVCMYGEDEREKIFRAKLDVPGIKYKDWVKAK